MDKKYIPTEYAKIKPITINVVVGEPNVKTGKRQKERVGIGGAVKVVPQKPKLPYTIREANSSEYKQAYERGYTKYVKVINMLTTIATSPESISKKKKKETNYTK